MSKKWRASTHAISDIRDWNQLCILILQPDYQRKEVWGDPAKVMLIDSILNGIPMPKIFVSSSINQQGRNDLLPQGWVNQYFCLPVSSAFRHHKKQQHKRNQ